MLKLRRNCLKCWGKTNDTQTDLLTFFSISAAGFAMKDDYTIPDCIEATQFLCRIGLLFTLRHYNPVRAAARKSLRFGGDMKSNPVCAEAV
jgi:hypothetical protein